MQSFDENLDNFFRRQALGSYCNFRALIVRKTTLIPLVDGLAVLEQRADNRRVLTALKHGTEGRVEEYSARVC